MKTEYSREDIASLEAALAKRPAPKKDDCFVQRRGATKRLFRKIGGEVRAVVEDDMLFESISATVDFVKPHKYPSSVLTDNDAVRMYGILKWMLAKRELQIRGITFEIAPRVKKRTIVTATITIH